MRRDQDLLARRAIAGLALIASTVSPPVSSAAVDVDDLMQLSLEDLMNIEVSSVSKGKGVLANSPAAIYVITAGDIKRSGVSTIPDALRMVPGMQVARIDGNKWAISARGFNSRFANKLLVLIDGRTVYNPTFSGVYWESQDYPLQDIERIEVIRGPGASLWGANAVNGVINIISKKTSATQGNLLATRVSSTDERHLTARHGGKIGGDTAYRLFGNYHQTGEFASEFGGSAYDQQETTRFGYRLDTSIGEQSSFTFQGDLFNSESEQLLLDPIPSSPTAFQYFEDQVDEKRWNLLGRWTHRDSKHSEFVLQAYVDSYERTEYMLDESRYSVDIEFQYRFSPWVRHELTLGGGYRHDEHDGAQTPLMDFDPHHRNSDVQSLFIQDQISLIGNKMHLLIGAKIEHTDYSPNNMDIQPNIRVSYDINDQHHVWGSIARSLRTASRAEQDGRLHVATMTDVLPVPISVIAVGNPDLEPEEMTAWELGYRALPQAGFSLDIAAFYNEYDELRGLAGDLTAVQQKPGEKGVSIEVGAANNGKARVYGLEVAANWSLSPGWQLKSAYSYIHQEDRLVGTEGLGSSPPSHQFNIRSQYDFSPDLQFDLWLRYVDHVTASDLGTDVDSYFTADLRLNWRPMTNLDVSLVGQNLLENEHREFSTEFLVSEETSVQRSIAAEVVWSF